MRKEFIVNRQGRDFVLYAGLIDQAHTEGLKRITTKLLQAPTADNGHLAICWAEVETDKGVFSGIGDASPDNVGRMIAQHCVRMAETRAKARALRDAINVGMSALEELADDDEPAQPRPAPRTTERPRGEMAAQPQRQVSQQQARPTPAAPATGDDLPASCVPATSEQISRLQKLQVALGRPVSVPEGLSQEQAATEIAALVKAFNSQAAPKR